MAEFFAGKRESAHFTVELNKGKAVIECTVWEHWKPLINDCVKCGAQVSHNLKRSIGIKATEMTTLEQSLKAAIGVKDLAEIKASAKVHVSTEICWETIAEETRSVTFAAPKCGRYLALQYQMIRDYHFRFQERKWFHKNSWQSYVAEHTSCYHDDSKQIDVDPDCNCRTPDPGDYDGLLHVDFGRPSMLVPFRNIAKGIEVTVAGKKVPMETPSGKVFDLIVPLALIPESLRFLGSMTEDSYKAVASFFAETEIDVAKTKMGVTAERSPIGAEEMATVAGAYSSSSVNES
jgi:hypothetical protein